MKRTPRQVTQPGRPWRASLRVSRPSVPSDCAGRGRGVGVEAGKSGPAPASSSAKGGGRVYFSGVTVSVGGGSERTLEPSGRGSLSLTAAPLCPPTGPQTHQHRFTGSGSPETLVNAVPNSWGRGRRSYCWGASGPFPFPANKPCPLSACSPDVGLLPEIQPPAAG